MKENDWANVRPFFPLSGYNNKSKYHYATLRCKNVLVSLNEAFFLLLSFLTTDLSIIIMEAHINPFCAYSLCLTKTDESSQW